MKKEKEVKNKSLKVIFSGPDENFNLDNADSLFNDELEIINRKTGKIRKAYKRTNFLFELICFMHGEPKSFDKNVVNNFAKDYPEILTMNENEHIYNMNNLLILFSKYGACYIEDDGHIVIDNSIFYKLRKYYKRKFKIIKILQREKTENNKNSFVFLCLKEDKRKRVTVKACTLNVAKYKLRKSGYKIAACLGE